jgi:hypothetical protein
LQLRKKKINKKKKKKKTKKKKDRRTNNDQQMTTQKIKERVIRTTLKTEGKAVHAPLVASVVTNKIKQKNNTNVKQTILT